MTPFIKAAEESIRQNIIHLKVSKRAGASKYIDDEQMVGEVLTNFDWIARNERSYNNDFARMSIYEVRFALENLVKKLSRGALKDHRLEDGRLQKIVDFCIQSLDDAQVLIAKKTEIDTLLAVRKVNAAWEELEEVYPLSGTMAITALLTRIIWILNRSVATDEAIYEHYSAYAINHWRIACLADEGAVEKTVESHNQEREANLKWNSNQFENDPKKIKWFDIE